MEKYQKPMLSIGKDNRGNEIVIILEDDGSYTNLTRETNHQPKTNTAIFYSKFFLKEQANV